MRTPAADPAPPSRYGAARPPSWASRLGLAAAAVWVSIAAVAAANQLVAVPAAPAPALELTDMAGKLHRLPDYRGKVVLVNFWASWCEPCRAEMPSMQMLEQRLQSRHGRAFAVLAVNHGENRARIAEFLKSQPLAFPVLQDPFGRAWQDWKPGLLPASYLIGRDGRVRYRVRGEIDWTAKEVETLVVRLLQEAE
jgi:thiol-disulfide isomerase/thioredoxin